MVYDKNKFKSVSPILATFDFQDIASGLGYNEFFIFECSDNTTDFFKLATQTFKSKDITNVIEVAYPGGGTPWTNSTSKEYKTSEFNTTRTISGTAFISFSAIFVLGVSGRFFYLEMELIKESSSGDTSLGTARTIEFSSSEAVANYFFPIETSRTSFAKGDKLKLKITLIIRTATDTSGTATTVTYGQDPANRDEGSFTGNFSSQTKISIPFEIEQ